MLALRVNRLATRETGGTVLIYRGPQEWVASIEREEPRSPGQLADDADRLLDQVPFSRSRANYLAAHVHAMRAVAHHLDDSSTTLPAYARECLGADVAWVAESILESAHDQLDAALPKSGGPLADRLHAWQARHRLRDIERLPDLVHAAVTETRARTEGVVALPPGEVVDCRLVSGALFAAAGHYDGELRSTIFINRDIPFNLADLLLVVAHEGHPGHIAESVLKDVHLVGGQGRVEEQIRFMLSPSFVISEGLGLHAESLIFPGDQAQAWLSDHILRPLDVRPDGSDFAAIHMARNVLWGAWANATFMIAEGRPAEAAAYLGRWALLSETELASAMNVFSAPGMQIYVLSYHHGWQLLRDWLDGDDRERRVRRLLTEQLLPSDLVAEQ